MALEVDWQQVALTKEGDETTVEEVGLRIIHKGGGSKTVRRGSIAAADTDLKPGAKLSKGSLRGRRDLNYVNLEVIALEHKDADCKYQFFEGDHDEHGLVFDPSEWSKPLNKTYQLRIEKMGDKGSNVVLRVRKRDPTNVFDSASDIVTAADK